MARYILATLFVLGIVGASSFMNAVTSMAAVS
jgi:hypothetical protein